MSKSAEWDLEQKAAIEKLKVERLDLVYAIRDLEPEANKVEIYELHEKISIIDDKLHAIDPKLI